MEEQIIFTEEAEDIKKQMGWIHLFGEDMEEIEQHNPIIPEKQMAWKFRRLQAIQDNQLALLPQEILPSHPTIQYLTKGDSDIAAA